MIRDPQTQLRALACAAAMTACSASHVADDAAVTTRPDAHQPDDVSVAVDAGSDAGSRTCAYGGGCELLHQDCGGGRACLPGPYASFCADEGSGRLGETCNGIGSCMPGLVCVAGASGTNTCCPMACDPADCRAPFSIYQRIADGNGALIPEGAGLCVQP